MIGLYLTLPEGLRYLAQANQGVTIINFDGEFEVKFTVDVYCKCRKNTCFICANGGDPVPHPLRRHLKDFLRNEEYISIKEGSDLPPRECQKCKHLRGRDTSRPTNLFEHLKLIDDPCPDCHVGYQHYTAGPITLNKLKHLLDDIAWAEAFGGISHHFYERETSKYVEWICMTTPIPKDRPA